MLSTKLILIYLEGPIPSYAFDNSKTLRNIKQNTLGGGLCKMKFLVLVSTRRCIFARHVGHIYMYRMYICAYGRH